jgi:hypothetical protein
MLAMEAIAVSWLATCVRAEQADIDPKDSPLPMANEPPPYAPNDFAAAAGIFSGRNILATPGDDQLAFELPWDEGAVSSIYRNEEMLKDIRDDMLADGFTEEDIARMGGRTSLVTIKANEPHPIFGQGLKCLLQLGAPIAEAAIAETAQSLNLWELSRPDLPPMFGSWCAGGQGLAYTSFFPTSYCIPGLPKVLVYWSVARHAEAKRKILEMSRH